MRKKPKRGISGPNEGQKERKQAKTRSVREYVKHTKGEREGQALNKNKEDRKETKKNVVRVRQKGKFYEGKSGEKLILESNVNMDFGYGCN